MFYFVANFTAKYFIYINGILIRPITDIRFSLIPVFSVILLHAFTIAINMIKKTRTVPNHAYEAVNHLHYIYGYGRFLTDLFFSFSNNCSLSLLKLYDCVRSLPIQFSVAEILSHVEWVTNHNKLAKLVWFIHAAAVWPVLPC